MLAIDLNVADDVGGDLGVAGIQDTPKFLVVLHEAVGFVDEEGRPDRLDIAKERGRRDVARKLRFWRQVEQQNEDSGLAATLRWRHQDHERRDVARVHRPRVQHP